MGFLHYAWFQSSYFRHIYTLDTRLIGHAFLSLVLHSFYTLSSALRCSAMLLQFDTPGDTIMSYESSTI